MPSVEAGHGPHGAPSRDILRRDGPILKVQIGFDRDFRPPEPPRLPVREWTALVDTGASSSCIDANLAERLALPIVDKTPVSGVTGAMHLDVYLAQIVVPELELAIHGRFHGAMLSIGGQPYDALLGRDFLSHCSMNYDGLTGAVTISNSSQ